MSIETIFGISFENFPVCGARYKTRPGLTYHYSHSHRDGASDENSRDSVPPVANGPPPLIGGGGLMIGSGAIGSNSNNNNNVLMSNITGSASGNSNSSSSVSGGGIILGAGSPMSIMPSSQQQPQQHIPPQIAQPPPGGSLGLPPISNMMAAAAAAAAAGAAAAGVNNTNMAAGFVSPSNSNSLTGAGGIGGLSLLGGPNTIMAGGGIVGGQTGGAVPPELVPQGPQHGVAIQGNVYQDSYVTFLNHPAGTALFFFTFIYTLCLSCACMLNDLFIYLFSIIIILCNEYVLLY